MSVKLKLLLVICTCSLVRGEGGETPRVIKIATIVPKDNSRLFSIQRIRPALEIANEKVREVGLLPHHNIAVNFADSECSIEIGMKEAIQFYVDREVDLFLGPCCDYAAAPIGRQIKYWDLPMITPGAMARDFAGLKASEFRLMTRVGPSVNSLVLMLVAVLEEYHWSKMKIIYNPDGQDYITIRYCHIVADGVHYGMPIKPPEYAKFEKVEEILNRMEHDIGRETAIVVLCASADSVREIMIKANELNFDNGEYVFLNIDLFSSKEDSERPWYRENDTAERNQKAKKAYEALMTVTLRKPTSPAYRNFSEEVKRRAGNESFTYGEDEVNSFVGAFHDAVILYALALNETLANNRSITNGTEITHRMWNRTFEGITGTVSIDSNGDRNADYSLLDMNPTTGKFEVVANYFGKDKKYMPVKKKQIHWAGNRKSAPPDTPMCGFDGAKCPPEKPFPEYGIVIIVLGTLLVIVLVAAFFIYRHIKLEAELAEMNWRVRWDDIMFGTMENDRRMRRQGSNLSLTRTTNGEACAEGRVLIERADAHELDWCQCGQCEATDGPTKRVCCRQLELYGIFQEGGTCITSNKEFREVVLNRDVLLAVFIHVMLIRKQRGVAPVSLNACKLRLMATRQFLCWMHKGQRLKKESRMAVPSCVSRAIRIEFPEDSREETSRGSVTDTSLTGVIPLETVA